MRWLPITYEEASSSYADLTVEEQVDLLEQDLKAHCEVIRDLSMTREAASHAEILAFSLLDALGFIANPKQKSGGGRRIRGFIENCIAIEDCKRFSVPAMLSALRRCDDESLHALRCHCEELFCKHWEPGSLPCIDMDLQEHEISGLIGGPTHHVRLRLSSGAPIELEKCKHSRLLAAKRNALTHQLVNKGLRSIASDLGPHYIWYANDSGDNTPESWELIYPVKFLIELCSKGIAVACNHLRQNNIMPYPMLLSAAPWLAD
jgi:hypothetical protein